MTEVLLIKQPLDVAAYGLAVFGICYAASGNPFLTRAVISPHLGSHYAQAPPLQNP
jgi:hypothetical protein